MQFKKVTKRFIAWVLCFVCIISLNSTPVNAAEIEDNYMPLSQADIPEVLSEDFIGERNHISRLHAEETDLNSIIFLNADNTATLYYFEDAVKFIGDDGEVFDKSNKLYSVTDVPDYAYFNRDNDINTFFPSSLSSERGILLKHDDLSVEMIPATLTSSAVTKSKSTSNSADIISYQSVFGENMEIRYIPTFTGFKEDIVLENGDKNEFSFILRTGNSHYAELMENGQLNIVSADGETVAFMEPIYVYDSFMDDLNIYSDNYCHGTWSSTLDLVELGNGEYYITIIVDEAYLNDSRTVYPVYIDPSINVNTSGSGASKTIQDVPIYNGNGAKNLPSGSNPYNLVGYVGSVNGADYGVGRTLMRFPGLLSNTTYKALSPSTLNNVTLYVYESSGLAQNTTLYAYQYTGTVWTETSANYAAVSWSGYTSPSASVSVGSTSQNTCAFNLTNIVTNWLSNSSKAEQGIMIKNSNESNAGYRKDLRSTESSAKPYIALTYTVKTFNARIYYDSSCTLTATYINKSYNDAIEGFETNYLIKFNRISTSTLSTLNGASCPNNTSNSSICTASCGTLSSCSSSHHRGSGRLYTVNSSASYYTYRLVGHALCYYNNGHSEVVGLGSLNGKDALTSTLTTPNLSRSIQHELTHNLGGSHSTCNANQKCVLQGDFGYWCDVCRANIFKNL